MRILGLIPARGGSKALPGKNVRPLLGRSLIQRAFESARASEVLDRIILSTDDPAIAAHGREVGVEVPFMRPQAFAEDTSPMIDVVVHALGALSAGGYDADAVMLLQPTSPLRSPRHIRDAVSRLEENDSVCTVVPLPKDLCPHYVMRIREDGYLDYFLPEGRNYTRRQDVPQAYRREGTIFLTRREVLLNVRNFYGAKCVPLAIDPSESLNIDDADDWRAAEERLSALQRG